MEIYLHTTERDSAPVWRNCEARAGSLRVPVLQVGTPAHAYRVPLWSIAPGIDPERHRGHDWTVLLSAEQAVEVLRSPHFPATPF